MFKGFSNALTPAKYCIWNRVKVDLQLGLLAGWLASDSLAGNWQTCEIRRHWTTLNSYKLLVWVNSKLTFVSIINVFASNLWKRCIGLQLVGTMMHWPSTGGYYDALAINWWVWWCIGHQLVGMMMHWPSTGEYDDALAINWWLQSWCLQIASGMQWACKWNSWWVWCFTGTLRMCGKFSSMQQSIG